ncbi:MAG: hypothetical protein RLZZ543_2124 [Bacteroidota bacterium]|jgi:ABC-type multidrug transport system ATPase subunit
MEITLNELGKRYNFNWIFNGVDWKIASGDRCVFLGSNGSGKSTLLQITSGALLPSTGTIEWVHQNKLVEAEKIYQFVSIAAPYLELIEEFSLRELVDFHFSIKTPLGGLSSQEIISIIGLSHASDRRISYFSSGMRQRVRLGLAILSDTPLLLLDEPLSNLDKKAESWYQELLKAYSFQRTILVSSNHLEEEYFICDRSLSIENYHV